MSAFAAAGRSIVRSFRLRPASVNLAGGVADAVIVNARSSLRLPKQRPTAARFLRSPVELSCCVESLLPVHSAVASARMNSKLSVAGGVNCGWAPLLRSTMISIS